MHRWLYDRNWFRVEVVVVHGLVIGRFFAVI